MEYLEYYYQMINIDHIKNQDLYTNHRKALDFLNTIEYSNYKFPEMTNFHVYSEIKNPMELLVIKSYLVTQNLKKTNLTLWSDYDISNNPLLKPYLNYITLKVYDPLAEGKDTVLEGKECLAARGIFSYQQSDIFRILILKKYGGIFVDMDIIFLRNMLPFLDQEFMYMWGRYTEKFEICATVLSLFKNSELANLLLEEASKIPLKPYGDRLWYACYLYDIVYKKHPFNILPAAFFDTEWQIENFHFDPFAPMPENTLYTEAFTWHWHNGGGRRQGIPQQNSKIQILNQIIDQALLAKNII